MNNEVLNQLKKLIKKKKACYIVITCDEPAKGGQMQVDMAYEGDEVLASYLLENAQSIIQSEVS